MERGDQMYSESEVRNKLITVLEHNGIKLKFIAAKLKWNYQNLVAFKNGKRKYSELRLKQLNDILEQINK
jgi:hypothetical protein